MIIMRLWHYELISYLPKSQLLAQWRELNSIFKKQPKHILINYVYEYPKGDLLCYSNKVLDEIRKRNIKIKSLENYQKYFSGKALWIYNDIIPFKNHHTYRYLKQCFYNLEEKYDRGQKDFSKEQFDKLEDFIDKQRLLH